MTENEAIKEVKRWTPTLLGMGSECTDETACAQDMAIRVLDKVQKYRKIGTIKECQTALKRQEKMRNLLACHDDFSPETAQINYELVKAVRKILEMK